MSFEKISDKTKNTNLFLFALYTFLSLLSMLFLPFAAFIGLSFIAIPVTTLILKRQTGKAIWSVLIALSIVFLFNYALALSVLAMIMAVAYFYMYCIEKDKSQRFVMIGVASIFVAGLMIYFLLFSLVNGFDALPEIASVYNGYIEDIAQDPAIESYRNIMGIESAELGPVLSQIQSFMRFLPKIIPGTIISFVGLASILNYKFSHIFFARYDVVLKDIRLFKEWDLNWYWCWGFIFGLVFIIIPDFNPALDQVLDVLGANLLIMFATVYLVLGLAVIWSLFDRFKLNTAVRVIILIIMFLFLGIIIVPILMGLIDIWANFRKLKRR